MMVYLNLFSFIGNCNSQSHLLKHIYAAFAVMGIHVLNYLRSMQTNLHYQCLRSKIASTNLKKLVRFIYALLCSMYKTHCSFLFLN